MAELIQEKKITGVIIKILALAILGLLAIYYFGHFLNLFLAFPSEGKILFFSCLAFAVFLIIFFFETIFISSNLQINLTIFLETLVLLFSLHQFSKPILIGIFLFFLFLIFGNLSVKKEINNTLKINFLKTNRIAFNEAITAFSLLFTIIIGVALFGFFNEGTFDLQKIIKPILLTAEKIMPADFTKNFLQQNLEKQISADSKLEVLPEEEKEKIINETLSQIEKQTGGKLSFSSIILNTKESQSFIQDLNNKILDIPSQIKIYIVIGISLIAFFVLKGIGVLLTWPITLIAFIIYELLFAANFAKITIEQREKEVISL